MAESNALGASRKQPLIVGVVYLVIPSVLFAASCSHGERTLGDSLTGTTALGEDAGEDALTPDASGGLSLCKGTECPAPYGTCPTDTFRCGTNFDTDNDNCGACGVSCARGDLVAEKFGAEWFCQAGRCKMRCDTSFTRHDDCNNEPADGCEVDLFGDANNCGSCGVRCGEGVPCVRGQCGCPIGFTYCEGGGTFGINPCINLTIADFDCGECGNPCSNADGPFPKTYLGCINARCERVKCKFLWGDCNNDLEADGCETSLEQDPQNCGRCGKKCGPSQKCIAGKCQCPGGETLCELPNGETACTNLDSDPNHCGVCGRRCPSTIRGPYNDVDPGVCRYGHCELHCPSGYADCDREPENGCETHISADPRNCGACGAQCDLAFGQPCVGGTCLRGPCTSGGTQ